MTKVAELIRTKSCFLSTEFLPPKNPNLSDLVSKTLKVASVIDAVSLPELKANAHSNSKYRMNPLFASFRLRALTGVETIFHITPRDINRNAAAGILLSALEARLQNVLVISGDRYTPQEHSSLARNVYDFSGSLQLIKWIRTLEADAAVPGFCIVAGTDPTVVYSGDTKKVEGEVARLIERQEAGADVIQTQPIFDLKYLDFFDLAKEQGLKVPVLVGVLPIRGEIDCVDIETRYGIVVPREVKSALKGNDEIGGWKMACDLGSRLVENGVSALHVYPRENCDFILDLARSAFGLTKTVP